MDKFSKKDKKADSNEDAKETNEKDNSRVGAASRARNRTVMLTPDMAGNIRARLMEGDEGSSRSGGTDSGFVSPLRRDASGAEKLRDSTRMIKREDIDLSANEGKKDKSDTAEFNEEQLKSMLGSVLEEEHKEPMSYESEAFVSQDSGIEYDEELVEEVIEDIFIQEPPQPSQSSKTSSAFSVVAAEQKRLVGFLVAYDQDPNGEIIELRVGRWLITSQASNQGDYILINHETVSPLHAILRVSDKGVLQVLDQLSEYGTKIKRLGEDQDEEVAGAMAILTHGDVVRFGERSFFVCLVPISDE